MISKLKGVIDEVGEDFVLLDVNGVVYHLSCSVQSLSSLPAVGQHVTLFTEMLVNENAMRLVGFLSPVEREWFRALNVVRGVGVKVALAILSALSLKELDEAVSYGDGTAICRAHGVGKKVAQRIVNELKDRHTGLQLAGLGQKIDAERGEGGPSKTVFTDVISALVNLGYSQGQSAEAVAQVRRGSDDDVDAQTLLRAALRSLAS